MKTSLAAALLTTLVAAGAAVAQTPTEPPKTWVSGSAVVYTAIAPMIDPGSNSRWQFDDTGFGGGLALQHELSQGLLLGVEGTLVRTKYERDGINTDIRLATGNASIATAMGTGRFAYGGGGPIGIYLTGGAGAIAYNLADLGTWNRDFALRAGTGIEFMVRPNLGLALEWNRLWAYHEKEELGGGRQNHSMLRLTGRYGL